MALANCSRLDGRMSRILSIAPGCPKCHQAMKLMLVKGKHERELRCIDCDLPDPLQNPEVHGWLKGELSPEK
jgi:hypothetical protein